MMDKNYSELMNEVKSKVEASFGEHSERDSYFLKTLDNFVYRYLEDDKVGPGTVERKENDLYIGAARTNSMKLAMEFAPEDQKEELAKKIKDIIAEKKRPTMEQRIVIDASDLDEDGQGSIKIQAVLNWDFPEHQSQEAQHIWNHKYEPEDWSHLRKHLALYLEEVCEHF